MTHREEETAAIVLAWVLYVLWLIAFPRIATPVTLAAVVLKLFLDTRQKP